MLAPAICVEASDPIRELVSKYIAYSRVRNERLFSEFLPRGYRLTTVTSVPESKVDRAVLSKLYLGMLITLIDDLADNPALRNPRLLAEIYLSIEGFLAGKDIDSILDPVLVDNDNFVLAKLLLKGLMETASSLPNYEKFRASLQFDLREIFLANRFSELISLQPELATLCEVKHHGPYNMGMVAAGTLDLMASPTIAEAKIAVAREIFLLGQRVGRICNVLTTLERELAEGDLTNEIIVRSRKEGLPLDSSENIEAFRAGLEREMELLFTKILANAGEAPFAVDAYVAGLRKLYRLHRRLEGVI